MGPTRRDDARTENDGLPAPVSAPELRGSIGTELRGSDELRSGAPRAESGADAATVMRPAHDRPRGTGAATLGRHGGTGCRPMSRAVRRQGPP